LVKPSISIIIRPSSMCLLLEVSLRPRPEARPAEVPGEVAGEHADQHVRLDAFFQPVEDRAQVQVIGFDVPEVPLVHSARTILRVVVV
jgi:hypothetical protein